MAENAKQAESDRRGRSRSGRSLAERRLDYWRQLERLGSKVIVEQPHLIADELIHHYNQTEARVKEFMVYLEALRKTIEAEESGFREYENQFLERLERERKKRDQMKAKIHRDRPDADELARQLALGEEEMKVLERRIVQEEAKAAGEVHEALKELRLERIRRQRKMEQQRSELVDARRLDRSETDPRLLEIGKQITKLEAELHEQEAAIDERLGEHQENLRLYSGQLSELRDDQRDHLIKVGDAVFHHQLGDDDLAGSFQRLRRMIREAVK
ncbi:MAG: hypothetical protein OSB21_11450 [Myxococcota bacterium]|nr:hypothetical protein [Myxococcota bacterium]